MNKIFRIVFNTTTGRWVVASEMAKGRTKGSANRVGVSLLGLSGLMVVAPSAFAGDFLQCNGDAVQALVSRNQATIGPNAGGPCATGAYGTILSDTSTPGANPAIGDAFITIGYNSVSPTPTVQGALTLNGPNGIRLQGATTTTGLATFQNGANLSNTKITGLASGNLAAGSTDAVNGGQLFSTNQIVTALGGRVTTAEGAITNLNDANRHIKATGANDGTDDAIAAIGSSVNNPTSYNNTVAIGAGANAGGGAGSIAIGDHATANFTNVAIGAGADASGAPRQSMALGINSKVTAWNSVALGANSIADRDNSVSVGKAGAEHVITYVAKGTADTDAVNVSQLKGVTTALGGSAGVNADGTIKAPSYTVQGQANIADVGTALGKLDTATTANTTNISNVTGRVTTAEGNITNLKDANRHIKANGANDGSDDAFAGIGTSDYNAAGYNQTVAIGASASSGGGGSISIGDHATTTFTNIAIGAGADATGATRLSTALGLNSKVTGWNSVALGANSIADRDNSVSVGKAGAEHVITYVAKGTADTDAVNVSQLKGVTTALGGSAGVNADGTIKAPSYTVQGQANIADVGTALGKLDTATTANATNITNVTGRVTTVEGNVSSLQTTVNNINSGSVGLVQQDATTRTISVAKGSNGTLVDLTGTAGARKLTGLSAGTLSATSTDAVNGTQLNTTNTNVTNLGSQLATTNTNVTNVTGRVTTAEGNITNLQTTVNNINSGTAGLVQQDATTRTISVAKGSNGTLVDLTGTAGARKLTGLSAGTLSATSTDAVNGTQLNATNANVTTNATNITALGGRVTTAEGNITNVTGRVTTAEGNISNLQTTVNNINSGSVGLVQQDATTRTISVAKGSNGTLVDLTGTAGARKLTGLSAGTLSATSTDAVNGTQLNATNANVTTNATNITALGGRVTTAEGNITNVTGRVTTAEGNISNLQTTVNNINSGSVGLVQQDATTRTISVAKGSNGTLVDLTGTAGARKLTGVSAGTLSATSTDAVNGTQLNATNANVTTNATNITALGGRVTTAEGNITNLGSQLTTTNTNVTNLGSQLTTTNTNVSNLTNQINSGSVGLVQQDATTRTISVAKGSNGTLVDLTGTAGARKLTGVSAGTLSATSTDAVNGMQLNTTNTNVTNLGSQLATTNTNVTNLGSQLTTTNTNVSNLQTTVNNINSGTAGLVQQDATTRTISVAKGTDGTLVDLTGTAGARKLTGVSAGTLSATSTDAVNGTQLNATNANVTTNATNITALGGRVTTAEGNITNVTGRVTTAEGNISNLQTTVNNINSGSVGLVQQDATTKTITVAKDTNGTLVDLTGTAGTRKLTGLSAGTLSATSTDAVNGSQLRATNAAVTTALGGGAGLNADGTIKAPSYTVQGQANIADVGTALGKLDTATTANTTSITGLGGRVTTAEGNITNLGNQLTTTNTNVSNLQTTVNNINSGSVGLVQQDATTKTITVAKDTNGTLVDLTGTAGTRKLTGLSAGTLSATSTDAVNGSQLRATNAAVTTALGGGAGLNADGTIKAPSYTVQGQANIADVGTALGKLDMATTANTTSITGLGGRVTTAEGNITNVTGRVTTAEGNITNVTGRVTTAEGNITNLQNTVNNINGGMAGLVQQDATTRTITVAKDTNGTLVDLTGTAGTRKLTGLSAGTLSATSTDAVNGSQLRATNAAVTTALGGGAGLNADGTIKAPSYTVQGQANIADVGTALGKLDTATTANTTSITGLGGRVTTAEGNITNVTGRVTTAEGNITNVTGRVTTAEGNITNLQTTVNNISSGTAGLVQQDATTRTISVAKGTDGALVDLTGTAGARKLTGVSTGTLSAASTDAVNGSQLFATNQNVTALGGRVTTAEGNITNVTGRVTAAEGNITNVTGRVTAAEGNITNVTGRVTTAEGNISNLQTTVNNINSGTAGLVQQDATTRTISVAKGTDGTLVDLTGTAGARKLTGVSNGTLSAASTDAVNGSQLNTTNQNVTALGGRVTTAEGNITNVTGRVTTAEGNITNLGSQLTTTNTNVSNLQTTVNNINSGTAGLVQQDATTRTISVAKGTDGTLVDLTGTAGARKLTGVSTGTLSAASTDAVNGSQLNTTNQNVAKNATDITALGGRVTTAEGDISTIKTDVAKSQGDISTIKTDVAKSQGDISTIKTDVAKSQGDISTIKTDVAKSQGDISTIKTDVTSIGGRVTTVEGNVSNLYTQLNSGSIGLVQQAAAGGKLTVGAGTDGSEVDFGNNAGKARKLTRVAAGTGGEDAVNVSQLKSVANGLGGGATIDPVTGLLTAPNYAMTNADGTQSSLHTVGDALTNLDGRVYGNTTRINSLTTQISSGTVGLVQQAGAGQKLTVGKDTDGSEVSFTNAAGEARKLGGVAGGAVSATSTDAINGGQFHGVSKSIATALGGGSAVNADGTISAPTYTVTNADGTTSKVAGVEGAIGNLDGRVHANTTRIDNVESSVNNLSSKIESGAVGLVQQSAPGEQLTVGKATDGTSVNFAGTAGDRALTGVAAGKADNDAVNIGQLKAAGVIGEKGEAKPVLGYDGADKNSVTLGGGNGGQPVAIHNVAAGVSDNDAVNVSQLNARLQAQTSAVLSQANGYTDDRFKSALKEIDTLRSDVDDRFQVQDERIDRMGAMSTAMASMTSSMSGVARDNRVGVGAGESNGRLAMAVGYQRAFRNGGATLTAGASFTDEDSSVGVGGGFGW